MAFLADISAWSVAQRRGAPADLRDEFRDLLLDDAIATCGVVRWELLHSTNNGAEFAARRASLAALRSCAIDDADFEVALDLCERLDALDGGSAHRALKLQDALVAVAARNAELPVLHYDAEFDRIARITGQPTRWIRPRGSL